MWLEGSLKSGIGARNDRGWCQQIVAGCAELTTAWICKLRNFASYGRSMYDLQVSTGNSDIVNMKFSLVLEDAVAVEALFDFGVISHDLLTLVSDTSELRILYRYWPNFALGKMANDSIGLVEYDSATTK
jgi:hypothetical protein